MSTVDRSPELIAVTSAFLSIAIFSIGLRIFMRLHLVIGVGADDILIICAGMASIAEAAGTIIGTKYGLGRHIDEQLVEWREPYAKSILTTYFSYTISATLIKVSFLAFYLRLFPDRALRVATYIAIFVSASFGIATLLTGALQCIPISMLWDFSQPGHCININLFYFANAGIHILTELLIYILPMRTLWKLHLPLRRRLGLCAILTITRLIVISCYRVATIRVLLGSEDLTWNTTTPLMWYTIELNLAIFIACGPAFLAFFRRYIPSVFGGSSAPSNDQASHRKNSYPLGTITRPATQANKSGLTTTVTARDRSYFGNDSNGSEERIVLSGSEIQRQVEVWMESEDVEGAKPDSRSNNSIGNGSLVQGV
ncbi:hypothetical protein DL95DRAFT_482812 [Leptodontidium sp. 2 PMI_412]|nr:hypothetical protein DL95DRAFT_482812 [Leptodontidium sp. 2 PMI_412]